MKLIGHRGAKGLAPENTIAAMQQGLAHQVDEIEIDVRVTKDNIVVLQHDADITASDGTAMLIRDYTLDKLKMYKTELVTLEEALTATGRAVPVQIEVKPDQPLAPIKQVINKLLSQGWTDKDLLFGSFDQAILVELHKAFPAIPIVVIDNWSSIKAVRRARQVGARRLSMNQRWMWWPVVRNLALMKYQLAVYTVNKPEQVRRWQRHGLYGVITDYPDRFNFRTTIDS